VPGPLDGDGRLFVYAAAARPASHDTAPITRSFVDLRSHFRPLTAAAGRAVVLRAGTRPPIVTGQKWAGRRAARSPEDNRRSARRGIEFLDRPARGVLASGSDGPAAYCLRGPPLGRAHLVAPEMRSARIRAPAGRPRRGVGRPSRFALTHTNHPARPASSLAIVDHNDKPAAGRISFAYGLQLRRSRPAAAVAAAAAVVVRRRAIVSVDTCEVFKCARRRPLTDRMRGGAGRPNGNNGKDARDKEAAVVGRSAPRPACGLAAWMPSNARPSVGLAPSAAAGPALSAIVSECHVFARAPSLSLSLSTPARIIGRCKNFSACVARANRRRRRLDASRRPSHSK
jgi:hypothetical protein